MFIRFLPLEATSQHAIPVTSATPVHLRLHRLDALVTLALDDIPAFPFGIRGILSDDIFPGGAVNYAHASFDGRSSLQRQDDPCPPA